MSRSEYAKNGIKHRFEPGAQRTSDLARLGVEAREYESESRLWDQSRLWVARDMESQHWFIVRDQTVAKGWSDKMLGPYLNHETASKALRRENAPRE